MTRAVRCRRDTWRAAIVPGGELVVVGLVVLAVVVLGGLLLRRAVRRRRQGWYDGDHSGPASTGARGAVNRNSWMLGGGAADPAGRIARGATAVHLRPGQ